MKAPFKSTGITIVLLAALTIGILPLLSAQAQDLQGTLAEAGKLYDNWYSVTKADTPKDTHPAWPASNTTQKGATTWRCKSCHGWDYLGAAGAYGSGSYKTGIKGINGMAGADVEKILKVLKNDTHKLSDKIDEKNFQKLALFVSKGQIDMHKYIDRATKTPKGGDTAKGASYYNTLCAQCHGEKGTLPKDMPDSLGKLMGNPWEVMHKIMNGQPKEQMPALRALDPQITVDIMTHLATLPKEK